jgi:hypothetical protein
LVLTFITLTLEGNPALMCALSITSNAKAIPKRQPVPPHSKALPR